MRVPLFLGHHVQKIILDLRYVVVNSFTRFMFSNLGLQNSET